MIAGACDDRWCAIADLSQASLANCSLHSTERLWSEKNCYADIWISVLHAIGADPHACLPFVLAIDFDDDQWTFFKPSLDDLYDLYGVQVQELNVWKPLIEHAREHVAQGRLISVESDAWWLPDTAGTDYRRKHTKTTIVLNDVDFGRRRLGYFHNTGYHTLDGEDFDRTFNLVSPIPPDFMPLFAELIKLDKLNIRSKRDLQISSQVLREKYLSRRPSTNPFLRFRSRFEAELPSLRELGLDHYHAWAFANTRQAGAAFELASQNLLWSNVEGDAGLTKAAVAFERIAAIMKGFVLKGARQVASKKPFDDPTAFVQAAELWDVGMDALCAASTQS